ncbi:MAG: ISNCY family transposase, partial [Pseudomonadota bacterium]
PRKGRLSEKAKAIEGTEIFANGRKKHSAIESAINGLENHGLDRCPDHGIIGFRRYVSLSVLARNLEMLGNIIKERELKRLKRINKNMRIEKVKHYRLAA